MQFPATTAAIVDPSNMVVLVDNQLNSQLSSAMNSSMNSMTINNMYGKDPRWLTLEVCREYQRGKCSRSEDECKFAHPPENVEVNNGKVIACFDNLKGRCQRTNPPCKYLHPPQHLKEILQHNGRNNLILRSLAMQSNLQQSTNQLYSPNIMTTPTLFTNGFQPGHVAIGSPSQFAPGTTFLHALTPQGPGTVQLEESPVRFLLEKVSCFVEHNNTDFDRHRLSTCADINIQDEVCLDTKCRQAYATPTNTIAAMLAGQPSPLAQTHAFVAINPNTAAAYGSPFPLALNAHPQLIDTSCLSFLQNPVVNNTQSSPSALIPNLFALRSTNNVSQPTRSDRLEKGSVLLLGNNMPRRIPNEQSLLRPSLWPFNQQLSTTNFTADKINSSNYLRLQQDASLFASVCSNFQKGVCPYASTICTFAHPPTHCPIDNEGLVTVCVDFVKGKCTRDTCKYFHPPEHLMVQLKSYSNNSQIPIVYGSTATNNLSRYIGNMMLANSNNTTPIQHISNGCLPSGGLVFTPSNNFQQTIPTNAFYTNNHQLMDTGLIQGRHAVIPTTYLVSNRGAVGDVVASCARKRVHGGDATNSLQEMESEETNTVDQDCPPKKQHLDEIELQNNN